MSGFTGHGLGESQKAILDHLKRIGKATLADLETTTTLGRETLRDHLKVLSARGLVSRAGVKRAGPGRPQILYKLTANGHDLFPQEEGRLLRDLISFLEDNGKIDLVEDFFRHRIANLRANFEPTLRQSSDSDRLEQVAEVLSEQGFLAEVQTQSAGGPRLCIYHCPLWNLVSVSKLPCHSEMSLVGSLLDRELHRESFMPAGDATCTYSLVPLGSGG